MRELLFLKISKFYLKVRGLGGAIHRRMESSHESMEDFKAHFEELTQAKKPKDIRDVFKEEIEDVQAAAKSILTAEDLDILITHEFGSKVKDIDETIHHTTPSIRINTKLFKDKRAVEFLKEHNIKTPEQLKEYIKTRYNMNAKAFSEKIRGMFKKTFETMEEKSKNQAWGERWGDYTDTAGVKAEYDAKQAPRWMRWMTGKLKKALSRSKSEAKRLRNRMKKSIKSYRDIKALFHSIEMLEQDLESAEPEAEKMIEKAMHAFSHCVLSYYHLMHMYHSLEVTVDKVHEHKQLRALSVEMKKMLKNLKSDINDMRLEERQTSSEARWCS